MHVPSLWIGDVLVAVAVYPRSERSLFLVPLDNGNVGDSRVDPQTNLTVL